MDVLNSDPVVWSDVQPVGEQTRYAQIAGTLRAAIASGQFALGATLPPEMELCRTFSVSRHTVREALRRLVELGLVERRQGSGTQVIATTPRANYVQSMRSLQELTQYARDTRLIVSDISTVIVSGENAAIIPAASGSRWMQISGIRWNAERTLRICATTVYVHMRFAPHLSDVESFGGPIYALIEERSGETIHSATQDITAHLMLRPVAKLLGVKAGEPAFRFVRRYLDASGVAMMTAVNWHGADGFVYSMSLRRDGATAEKS